MRFLSQRMVLATLLGPTLTACATSSIEPSLDAVKAQLADRAAANIVYDQAGADAERVDQEAKTILSKPLTVDSAVQLALLKSPTVQVLYEDVGIAQADLAEAGLLSNPVLSGSAILPTSSGSTIADLGIVQNVLTVLLRPARKKIASGELARTEMQVAAEVLEHIAEVKRAYYEVQAAQHVATVRRSKASASEASGDLAVRFHEAGNIRGRE